MPKRYHQTQISSSNHVILYGFHAVSAALRNKERQIHRLIATPQAAERIAPLLSERPIPVITTQMADLNHHLGNGAVHQGLMLEASLLRPPSLEMLAPASPLIMLDHVTDPHNVGAILRSASAFGAGAVISQDRHAPPPTGALAKAAAGALEYIPYLQVTNISRALSQLKRDGYWIAGLDHDGNQTMGDMIDKKPLVIVLGAEGTGLRRLTRNHCDLIVRLDLPGPIKALNVSNAAAIALYATQNADKKQA